MNTKEIDETAQNIVDIFFELGARVGVQEYHAVRNALINAQVDGMQKALRLIDKHDPAHNSSWVPNKNYWGNTLREELQALLKPKE
jgi:hypothetical protein